MKKILLAITVFIITGCNTIIENKECCLIITAKEQTTFTTGPCKYSVDNPYGGDFTIHDSCDCYDVGDTIQLQKKHITAQ